MNRTASLRELVDSEDGLVLPGVANALGARIAQDIGFAALYVSGAGVTNTFLGLPDLGLLSLSEMAAHVSAITDAVGIPVIVDADTGYGNAVSVARTVQVLEKAGAAGIQLEDQVAPKRCGHFEGQEVISAAEMRQKIRAAVEHRADERTYLIARTDARARYGLPEAIERAAAYADAGADAVFIEGPLSREELVDIGNAVPGVPKLANLVEGGKTPLLPKDELLAMGFSIILFANAAMQGAIHGTQQVLRGLRETGSLAPVLTQLTPWAERQRLVRKPHFDELETHYTVEDA